MEKVWAALEEPFPELTQLNLGFRDKGETVPVVPDLFLGGSAPRLHFLSLTHVPFPFPVLRKLHLSAPPHPSFP